ncbi:hypothetical protein [Tenacibaculum aestuarii]|uniref:hypothetical protein n=1 Tax=Tenacibaculum aestuarii TaxID=362781 RepID=UPI003895A6C9
MQKNIIYILFAVVFAGMIFQSCQDDPRFPDPGFEIEDQRIEIRRDTADFYDIKMKMNVPNGVQRIDLIDATDYSLIKEINEYNGNKNFDFNYRVDLTPFVKDTVLNYIVKVLDTDKRSFNQGIRIAVKAFSFPEIKLVGGQNIAVAAPAYNVKGLISTGLNTINTVKVLFDGQEQYSFTASPDNPLHEMPLKALIFFGNLDPSLEYPIDIVITDDKGQESTTTINVRKSETVKKPILINMLNSSNILIKIVPDYDEKERITGFDFLWSNTGRNYRTDFEYNDLDMVTKTTYKNIDSEGLYTREYVTNITYIEGTKQIISIDQNEIDYDEFGNIATEETTTLANNFIYDGSGNVLSFSTTSIVENIYYSDPFNLGESVYGDFWQRDSYISSNTVRRQHREDYDPVLVPTYTEGLPPFFENGSSVLFQMMQDIFVNKYLMTKTVPTDPSYSSTYLLEPAFTYETDEEGNISTIVRTNVGGGFNDKGDTTIYSFFYE